MTRLAQAGSGIMLIAVLAFLGLLLVVVPPQLVSQYEIVSRAGPLVRWGYLAVVGSGAVLLAGTTLYTFWLLWRASARKAARRDRRRQNPSGLTTQQQREEIAHNLEALEAIRDDASLGAEVRREVEPLVARLGEKQRSQQLEIVAFGTVSGGKSSVLNALAGREVFATDLRGGTTVRRQEIAWPGADRVTLVDTPGLGEVGGEPHLREAADAARDADAILLVVDGPLRESEFQLLQRLGEMEKRLLVCVNKSDWYPESEQQRLAEQLEDQLRRVAQRPQVVFVQAEPVTRQRVRVLSDGREVSETVEQPARLDELAEALLRVVRREGPDLLLANLLLQSRGLVEVARERVRCKLDERAGEIVDRYMWGAGGAAALSPLPLVDLMAGSAITAKMVLDLARVYHQDVDMNTAVRLLAQLGKNLIAILGVGAVTPAVAAAVGSLLKTVPGAGTLAGGMLQGITQALVTRWIGRVFSEYFRHEMTAGEKGLAELARREWDAVTRISALHDLVRTARRQWAEGGPHPPAQPGERAQANPPATRSDQGQET